MGMTFFHDIALSNRTTCRECHQTICKDTPRLKIYDGDYFGHASYKYACCKCSLKILQDEQISIDELFRKFQIEFERGRKEFEVITDGRKN